MKKLFLLVLTVLCIFTVESFQSSAQNQMMMNTPDFKTAMKGNSSAFYEVIFEEGHEKETREMIYTMISKGNRAEDPNELKAKAMRIGVLEVDKETPNVFYYAGMIPPVHNLFPISGIPEIEFNDKEETGYYSGIRHDDQAAYFSMIENGDIRLLPWNRVEPDTEETVLYFFAQSPSEWLDLVYDLSQQFPDMTFRKKKLDQVYPYTQYSMMSQDYARRRKTQMLFTSGLLTVLLAVTVLNGKLKGQKRGKEYLSSAVISMGLIPAVILILSRFEHIPWNTYTTFYYNDLFHFYGLVTAGFALVGLLVVCKMRKEK